MNAIKEGTVIRQKSNEMFIEDCTLDFFLCELSQLSCGSKLVLAPEQVLELGRYIDSLDVNNSSIVTIAELVVSCDDDLQKSICLANVAFMVQYHVDEMMRLLESVQRLDDCYKIEGLSRHIDGLGENIGVLGTISGLMNGYCGEVEKDISFLAVGGLVEHYAKIMSGLIESIRSFVE